MDVNKNQIIFMLDCFSELKFLYCDENIKNLIEVYNDDCLDLIDFVNFEHDFYPDKNSIYSGEYCINNDYIDIYGLNKIFDFKIN